MDVDVAVVEDVIRPPMNTHAKVAVGRCVGDAFKSVVQLVSNQRLYAIRQVRDEYLCRFAPGWHRSIVRVDAFDDTHVGVEGEDVLARAADAYKAFGRAERVDDRRAERVADRGTHFSEQCLAR